MFWLGQQMTLAWGCRDSPFGWGEKQILFSKQVKSSFYFFAKRIGKFGFPANLLAREGHPVYGTVKISGILGTSFWVKGVLIRCTCQHFVGLPRAHNGCKCCWSEMLVPLKFPQSFPANYVQTTALFAFFAGRVKFHIPRAIYYQSQLTDY